MLPARQLLPQLVSTAAASTHSVLSSKDALEVYRLCYTSRLLDDTEIALKHQNHAFFQISGAGHEIVGAVASLFLRAGSDWFFPYYRDRSLCLGLGVTPLAMLKQSVGAADCVASRGRQMPSHWSDPGLHIVSESSPTGVQFITAVGAAEAGYLAAQTAMPQVHWSQGEVVYCSAGEGATSEGWFFEGLSVACLRQLPVLFHIQNNGYAISVPVEHQTPGGDITKLVQGFPHLLCLNFDGCCPLATAYAWAEGTTYARAGRGPVLLHAQVVRPYSHSLSDDARNYIRPSLLELAEKREPLSRCYQMLLNDFAISAQKIAEIEQQAKKEVEAARAAALSCSAPTGSDVSTYIFSANNPATALKYAVAPMPQSQYPPQTLVDAINMTLSSEMERNPQLVVFGQDVADAADDQILGEVQGKGGVFRVTLGLQRRFGDRRVFNTPLSEAGIIGRAVGMALRGLKPVVEIQFFDYIFAAMMHIRSELACLRWRSGNGFAAPVVIRCPYGGYLRGGAIYHSQTGETMFAHQPGLRVVLPSCSEDAVGLLRTAIRCDDPVLFLEHKHLYRQPYAKSIYPGDNYCLPFGKARICQVGHDLTVITYGALVKKCLDAAIFLQQTVSLSVEVIDLRSLVPYDEETICTSVKKTSKVCVVHEEAKSFGFGAEIASFIQEKLFYELDAPVMRIGSLNSFVGYHPNLEQVILPQTENIIEKLLQLSRQ